MNGIGKAIFLWGVICLLGFGIYHFYLLDQNFPKPLPVWTALTIIGIIGMALWVPNWTKNSTVHVWLVVGVIGMLIHWYYSMQNTNPPFGAWGYWALLMAAGFLVTGHTWKHNFYYYVGVLNLIVFAILVGAPAVIGMSASAVLAVTSGVPLLYDGYVNNKH